VFKWGVPEVIAAATNLLYKRTCFRYPGLCTRTVIACVCNQSPCGCSKRCCNIGSSGQPEYPIDLTSDFPIHSITSIVIKRFGEPDETLDPGAYRLDENDRVVRYDGNPWPTCWADILITYTTGRVPPIELEMAAAELADELLKACNGGSDCKLPAHVRSVTRRGVESEVWDVVALMSSGLTGLPMVDHALSVHGGPCRKSVMFDATRSHPTTRVS
jgi:hypothetical protein